jgi:hypothetical protein
MRLPLFGPRHHREGMALQERAGASCRNPQLHVLPCLDFDGARKLHANLDGIAGRSDVGPREARAPGFVAVEDAEQLQTQHGQEQSGKSIHDQAGKQRRVPQVIPDREGVQKGERLVCPEKQLVRRPPQYGKRQDQEQTQRRCTLSAACQLLLDVRRRVDRANTYHECPHVLCHVQRERRPGGHHCHHVERKKQHRNRPGCAMNAPEGVQGDT